MKTKQVKTILKPATICVALLVSIAWINNPAKTNNSPRVAIEELTRHQWTIAEYKETIFDTVRNLTLAMMPCDRDQELKYENDKTYKIVDKCGSVQQVKGQGKWNYNEGDNTISEKFSSGGTIYKKILSLDQGMLRIEFEGEAKKKITITYLSEVGKQDDSKADQYVDNSDPASIIMQMIRDEIAGMDKYMIVSLSDFVNGVDVPGMSKKVVITPLVNLSDRNKIKNYDPKGAEMKLVEMGKKANVDYIITGVIASLERGVGPDKKPLARIKYSVKVLNVKKGKVIRDDDFAFPGESKSEKSARVWGNVVGAIANAHAYTPYTPYYGYGYGYYWAGNSSRSLSNLYYSGYAARSAARSAGNAYYNYSVFSRAVNADERNSYVASSLSVMESIEMTQEDLHKFLEKSALFMK
ncbi:MAG: hypothetical protein JST02_05870 [Bacteroidetes bacterium]|nr:hypothetical protein [Bacteroidota bacterium]